MTVAPTKVIPTSILRDLIAAEVPDLIAIRRDLHAHPELGYSEQRTSGIVKRELEAAGIEHVGDLAGGTGVLAHLAGPPPTPTTAPGNGTARAIGLRADMDALPITEATGLPYKSTNAGVMHACGHDGHTAILIGTARILARLAGVNGGLPRPVTFIFQPAEEGGAGGKRMVEDGCLDGSLLGPPIEHMFGLHGWTLLELGKVMTRPGPMLAASDVFEIEITGRGGHAAMPHMTADPIVAGSAVVSALQHIASRNADPLDSIVVSITQFHAGTTHNIIPERIHFAGTVRTLKAETQEMAINRVNEIALDIARAHQCEAEVSYHIGYPVTMNDPAMVELFNETARAALGRERVKHMDLPVMGGEDFSFYGQRVPSCFFALGLIPEGQDSMIPVHHPKFDFNDDAIATGVEMFCRLALREA